MKIFSKHRKKIDPYRRYGSKEFKEKLNVAKSYKRLGFNPQKGFSAFFTKTGLSRAGTFVAIAGFAVIFYFLVLSPYFLITNVSVTGNRQVSAETIQSTIAESSKKRFLLVPQNSFFVLSQSRASNLFAEQIPEIKEVKAKRSWPNRISFEVTERTTALVLAVDGKNYLIDDQGFVIKETNDFSDKFLITDQVSEEIEAGKIIGGKLIPFVISLQKQWPNKITVPIASAKIPGKGAAEVEFVSKEGWSVFFSTDRPVTNQLSNLAVLLAKQIHAGDRPRLAYIDLRLAKWAYYCFKASPCQQTDQSALPETAGAVKSTVESTDKPEENSSNN